MDELPTIEVCYKITSTDGLKKWNIPADAIINVDDRVFVKLARSAVGFATIVFHNCEQLPQDVPKGYSLTTSLGESDMVARRDRQDHTERVERAVACAPALFKKQMKVNEKKIKSKTRSDIQELRRSTADTMHIELTDVKDDEGITKRVEVLRPIHPRDELAVPLNAEAIANVIKFLQISGSSQQQQKRKRSGIPDDCPHGIWSRKRHNGVQYFLKAKTVDGKTTSKSYATMVGAITGIEEEIQSDEDERDRDVAEVSIDGNHDVQIEGSESHAANSYDVDGSNGSI